MFGRKKKLLDLQTRLDDLECEMKFEHNNIKSLGEANWENGKKYLKLREGKVFKAILEHLVDYCTTDDEATKHEMLSKGYRNIAKIDDIYVLVKEKKDATR